MRLAKLKPYYYTLEQYLEIEREADERSEFLDGEIYGMAGESGAHADICVNLIGSLGLQLRGTRNRVRAIATKVKSGSVRDQFGKEMISYPDVIVICGEPQYHDKHTDVVLNPTVIVEVLSESTAKFDRGTKFMRYRSYNPTLTDYVLVSQDEAHVEHYIRQENGDWLLREYYGTDKTFPIDSIRCSLNLADVYDRVDFEREDQ